MKLSVIIPVFNEKNTILEVLKKVESVKIKEISKEMIIIDDFSTDGTREILQNFQKLKQNYKIIFHEKNLGKGAAVRTGIKNVTGDFIIIQDADLEYDPSDYPSILQPLIDKKADAVYGSRFMNKRSAELNKPSFLQQIFYMGNLFLTFFTNLLYGASLTDIETGYKAFKTEIVKQINLSSTGFNFEPEITAKLLKKGYKIYEVSISYNSRSFKEGKKITMIDGLKAAWYLLKYRFVD